MKMDLTLFMLAFSLMWKLSSCVRCYKCQGERVLPTDYLCEHFDYSDKYITDCPDSTMCFKKIVTLDFNGHIIKTSERGCAMQIISGDQRKINGKWQSVRNIYEVYDDGCAEDQSNIRGERATISTHCYCRGHLCNSDLLTSRSSFSILLLSLLIPWILS